MSTKGTKYSLEHNWVSLKRTVVSIGVTDYFIHELGDLIDLSLPKFSDEIIAGISYGEIESINEFYDLTAPINGGVVKVNEDIVTKLKTLQKDPFGEGWFLKVKILDPGQLDDLMDEDEYEEYTKNLKKKKKKQSSKS